MKVLKALFKYYPDKSKKPNPKGLVIGALYDFGWVLFLVIIFFGIAVVDTKDYWIRVQTIKFSILIMLFVAIQILAVEFCLWWAYYLTKAKKKIRLIIFALAGLGLILFFQWCSNFTKIDTCLDRGGAWDYFNATCDGARID